MIRNIAATAALLGLTATPALAHLDPVAHGSFAAGVSHPLSGADHMLAMVAVGLWAVLLAQAAGRRALWLVPSAFVGMMAAGFVAAIVALPLPFVEPAILASVVVIGLLSAAALDVAILPAMALVGVFAIFHGHAHGGEIGAAGAWPYAAGFALATALLHAAGVAGGLVFGKALGGAAGRLATRLGGGAAALAGLWLAMAG